MIVRIIKKLSLLVIVLFFYICSSLYLYAEDYLFNIKNATHEKITLYFHWEGCGAEGIHNDARGKVHHDTVHIGSGVTYSFHKGCIHYERDIGFIPALSGRSEEELHITLKNRDDGYNGTLSAKSPKFSWLNGQEVNSNFTLVLRYNKTRPGTVKGYYWSLK